MKRLWSSHSGRVLALAILISASLGVTMAQGDGEGRPRAGTETSAYDLSWWTIDGGGTTDAGGGAYTLGGSAGQPDAALWSGGGYVLVGGFWGGAAVEFHLYLPLVLRSDGL
jgi:hypothetical protein